MLVFVLPLVVAAATNWEKRAVFSYRFAAGCGAVALPRQRGEITGFGASPLMRLA